MTYGPDMARVAALIGDPSRSMMLCALMGGEALTATELAREGGVTKQTASTHLGQLLDGGLLTMQKQGRHRYFSLANADVAHLLENLITISGAMGTRKSMPGPKDKRLRKARICYDHMAGEMGVALYDGLLERKLLTLGGAHSSETGIGLNEKGRHYFNGFGIDVNKLEESRRPVCRTCLDWSVRRQHLAGSLGAAILERMFELNWVRKSETPRLLVFTPKGERLFSEKFGITADVS
ncbi:MAG: helix-turn-helix transcriptional regulator [Pseudomonadota bacterium]